MKINKYLNDLLQGAGEYALTEQDVDLIERKGLQEYLLAKFFSKKFRKWHLDDECKSRVQGEIDQAIIEDRPIRVFFAQGSYKLWRVDSSPNVNWAEFFNLFYFISYMAPIAAAYSHGIDFTYYFLTVLPQVHNNLSDDEVTSYLNSFKNLMDRFAKYLPDNIKFKLETDLNNRSRPEYDSLFDSAMNIASTEFFVWPPEKQADYMRRAHLNIKWDGVEDWIHLSESDKEEKVQKAILSEFAATQVILKADEQNRGIILSTLPKQGAIGVGSTSTSIVKHWVGEGVIEEDDGNYYPRILSPSQYLSAKELSHDVVPIEMFDDKSFSKIEVFSRHFDFTKK